MADLNNDTFADIIVTNRLSNDTNIFLGFNNGSFAPSITIPVGYYPEGVVVGDFDHDGRNDLAIAHNQENTIGIIKNLCA